MYMCADDDLMEEARDISTHIYSFYKEIFSVEPRFRVALTLDLLACGGLGLGHRESGSRPPIIS